MSVALAATWVPRGEWPILVHRAGLAVRYVAVDGVDWETPDQFRDRPADPEPAVNMPRLPINTPTAGLRGFEPRRKSSTKESRR